MITPDDNGYGRVKRWRERNRGYVNLKQREYRRRKKGGVEGSSDVITERPRDKGHVTADKSAPSFSTKKVGEFRMIVIPEGKDEETPVKPVVFRNDHGSVITQRQWEILQERKRRAKEGGYTIDDYSQ